ncbi:hypothetical protein JKP88DRAFT_275928 [Tribonema minus]|uniref:Uncharacterized protein n=1 Tax=Tribonema minus TaxID=303371 RepID=A0A835ZCW4_9STRA|nr:hypothetical protein JKP88DRAFT_275928 [Tribonema minus]
MYGKELTAEEITANFKAALPNSPPYVANVSFTISEDGELGSHYDTPEYYLAEVPVADLATFTLPAYDLESDPAATFVYNATNPPPVLYLTSLPSVGLLYDSQGAVIDTFPHQLAKSTLRYRPVANESRGTDTPYATFTYYAEDGSTGVKSPLNATVTLYVTAANDPPVASETEPFSAFTGVKTMVCVTGTDIDAGDSVVSALVASAPQRGKLYAAHSTTDAELSAGQPFGDSLSELCIAYLYNGTGLAAAAAGAVVDTDFFTLKVVDKGGAASLAHNATITVYQVAAALDASASGFTFEFWLRHHPSSSNASQPILSISGPVTGSSTVTTTACSADMSRFDFYRPPYVANVSFTISEDGELGSHYDTPEYYLAEVPVADLATFTLPAYDLESDPAATFVYNATNPPPVLYLTSLPSVGLLYDSQGAVIDTFPHQLAKSTLRYRPVANESRGTDTPYATFTYYAEDGSTGVKSPLNATVTLYVTAANDPPVASETEPFSAFAGVKTMVCVTGTDIDAGDSVVSALVASAPQRGKLYAAHSTTDTELSADQPFGDSELCIVYLYNGTGLAAAAAGAVVDTDFFTFKVVDKGGAASLAHNVTITVYQGPVSSPDASSTTGTGRTPGALFLYEFSSADCTSGAALPDTSAAHVFGSLARSAAVTCPQSDGVSSSDAELTSARLTSADSAVAVAAALDASTSGFTFEFWLRHHPSSSNASQPILSISGPVTGSSTVTTTACSADMSRFDFYRPPYVGNVSFTISEDGELGSHYDTPEYYLAEVPVADLASFTLPAYDLERDPAASFVYDPTAPPPTLLLTSLPARGQLYDSALRRVASAPHQLPDATLRYRPAANESSGADAPYATLSYCAFDGVTGARSASSAAVALHVLPKNDPPAAAAAALTAVAGTADNILCVGGTDIDAGDAVVSGAVASAPAKGYLLAVKNGAVDAAGAALAPGAPFGTWQLCVAYVYTGSAAAAAGGVVDRDSFTFRVADKSGNYSLPAMAVVTVVSQLVVGGLGAGNGTVLDYVNGVKRWRALEQGDTIITLFGRDVGSTPQPLKLVVSAVPARGALLDRSTMTALAPGAALSPTLAYPYTAGADVIYRPPAGAPFFTYPAQAWGGEALTGLGAPEAFAYHAVRVAGGSAAQAQQRGADAREEIAVVNVNAATALACPRAAFAAGAVGAARADARTGALELLDRVYMTGFEVTDPDRGVDAVRVTVAAAHGLLSLNETALASGAIDFNSAARCRAAGAGWACTSGGASVAAMTFVATPAAATAALRGLRYQTVVSGVNDTVTVTLYDGAGGACLPELAFKTPSYRAGCFVTTCSASVVVDAAGSTYGGSAGAGAGAGVGGGLLHLPHLPLQAWIGVCAAVVLLLLLTLKYTLRDGRWRVCCARLGGRGGAAHGGAAAPAPVVSAAWLARAGSGGGAAVGAAVNLTSAAVNKYLHQPTGYQQADTRTTYSAAAEAHAAQGGSGNSYGGGGGGATPPMTPYKAASSSADVRWHVFAHSPSHSRISQRGGGGGGGGSGGGARREEPYEAPLDLATMQRLLAWPDIEANAGGAAEEVEHRFTGAPGGGGGGAEDGEEDDEAVERCAARGRGPQLRAADQLGSTLESLRALAHSDASAGEHALYVDRGCWSDSEGSEELGA